MSWKGVEAMNKTETLSIRVSQEELEAIKRAAKLEAYSSYSEFIRRTILLETNTILEKSKKDTEKTTQS